MSGPQGGRHDGRPPAIRDRAALAISAAFLLAACGGGEDLIPTYDLAAKLHAAEITREPRSIAFESAADRRRLRSGWSRNEHDPGLGRGFAWAVGDASVVELPLLAARDLELRLEGRPFLYPGAPRQAVTVAINGRRIDEIELRPKLGAYDLVLPGEHLRAGVNLLELAYRSSRSPRNLGLSDDRRSLAVAWYDIRLGSEGAEGPDPRAEPGDSPLLFVPYGTKVDYFLELAPGSTLRLDRWSFRGDASGRLEIALQAEGEESTGVAVLESSGSSAAYRLPGDDTRLALLTVSALAAVPGTGGVALSRPAVWSPPSSPRRAEKAPGRPLPRPRPHVVLYLIDTLRADHLGCYGYDRPVSPRIDAFAREAVLFEHAVAQSSWTRSSVASILTGQWPHAHGTNGRSDRLSAAAATLPEQLRAAGYRTAAFVTNPNVTPGFGFDQGFDDFSYLGEETGSDGVHRGIVEWLDAQAGASPFFLYVHTLDPHAPYAAPQSFVRRLAPAVGETSARPGLLDDLQAGRVEATGAITRDLEALYDAEIAFNDHSFGALLDELEARGLAAETLVILVSDHGEEFRDHGNWQHGRSLHGESIDVPLIVRLPGSPGGRRVERRVQHVDLLPTVLDVLGLPAGPGVEGRSLLPLMGASAAAGGDGSRVFSYLHLDGPARVSVHDGDWKLIQSVEHGELVWPRLYRRGDDPRETANLADRFPIRAGYLAGLMRDKLAATAHRLETEEATIDDDVRRSLQALGYLE